MGSKYELYELADKMKDELASKLEMAQLEKVSSQREIDTLQAENDQLRSKLEVKKEEGSKKNDDMISKLSVSQSGEVSDLGDVPEPMGDPDGGMSKKGSDPKDSLQNYLEKNYGT